MPPRNQEAVTDPSTGSPGWKRVYELETADLELDGCWYRLDTLGALVWVEGRLGIGLRRAAGARLINELSTLQRLVQDAVASGKELPYSYVRRYTADTDQQRLLLQEHNRNRRGQAS